MKLTFLRALAAALLFSSAGAAHAGVCEGVYAFVSNQTHGVLEIHTTSALWKWPESFVGTLRDNRYNAESTAVSGYCTINGDISFRRVSRNDGWTQNYWGKFSGRWSVAHGSFTHPGDGERGWHMNQTSTVGEVSSASTGQR